MAATVSLKVLRLALCFALTSLLIAACGGGGGGGVGSSATTYTIGGSITGLTGTLVLQNNGANSLSRSANGSFTFASAVTSGASYNVTVLTQPANQTCTVTNATGTATAIVTNVTITCVDHMFTLGGTVSGLGGTLVLVENNADAVPVTTSGGFQFPASLHPAEAYSVTVYKQPLGQTCTVTSGATGAATANVSNVVVSCANNPYIVSGTVSAIAGTVVLQLNFADNITVSNGAFTFPKPLAAGTVYQVSIVPGSTSSLCNVINGAGTANANVTNIGVSCMPPAGAFTLGGRMQGLVGNVTLLNSATTETITRSADGAFFFPAYLSTGAEYAVTVQAQPSGQTCTVVNGVGTISDASPSITAILNGTSPDLLAVTCVNGTETHTVGGTVTGLKAPLRLGIDKSNGYLDVTPPVSGAAPYAFPNPLQVGTQFQVYIRAQPAGQTCVIPHSKSSVVHANLTDIAITCVDNVTDQLVGSYTSVDHSFVVSLYGNGTYVFASVNDDAACGSSRGTGIEMGAYHYDATAGTLAFINNMLDTNGGSCGVWRNGASIINGPLVKAGTGQAAVLKLTPTTGLPVVLVPVNAVPGLPLGTFFASISSSFLWLRDDGRYIEVNANDDPTNNAPAGLEYGCYALAGAGNGVLTPSITTATCAGAIDTDNAAGLSAAGFESYVVNPSSMTFNNQTILLRLLAN